jgi:hypothetical protein
MSVTAVIREYNPSTGNLLGTVNSFDYGNVNLGEFCSVRVFDIYAPNASYISNVTVQITSSPKIVVNATPVDIGADGSAGNGNFGIETSTSFVARNTLTRFFAGLSAPVTVGTRAGNISKFIYLNVRMALDSADSGSAVYKVSFDYS